jgi:hypothetical protein
MWLYAQYARSLTLGTVILRLRKSTSCKSFFVILSFAINTLFRCIDHCMHHTTYHFIRELGISSTRRNMKKSRALVNDEGNINLTEPKDDLDADLDDNADIDTLMNIEASADDVKAMMATTVVNFKPRDTLGKLLTFINQVRMSNEGVRDLLTQMCKMHMIKPIELHLWVYMH